MNIAITTGVQAHHKYFINILKKYFPDDIKLVVIQKSSQIYDNINKNSFCRKIIIIFFRFFKLITYGFWGLKLPSKIEIFYTNDINSSETSDLFKKRGIDLLLVCGGRIIKKDILNILDNKIINIHNGYSPFYKGSHTLFFPILEEKYHLVGTTIHWLTENVDGGNVIIRNRFYPDNYLFKDFLFIASFKKSVNSLIIILKLFLINFKLPSIKENHDAGKVYYHKEFDPNKSVLLNKKLKHLFFKKYFN